MAGLVEGPIRLRFRDAGGSYRTSSRLWQPGLSLWFDDGGLEQFRIPSPLPHAVVSRARYKPPYNLNVS